MEETNHGAYVILEVGKKQFVAVHSTGEVILVPNLAQACLFHYRSDADLCMRTYCPSGAYKITKVSVDE